MTQEQKTDIKIRKNLVLKRSNLNNSLDKYNSNSWNNFNKMDRKHIDQIFTKSVIKSEEDAINRIGEMIESEKVSHYNKTKLSLDVAADFIARSFYNQTNAGTNNISLNNDKSNNSEISKMQVYNQ